MASHIEFNRETTAEQVAAAFSTQIAGKTVLITGVSPNGLGAAAALALSKYSPGKLILTARTPNKAAAVVDHLKTMHARSETHYAIVELDLSSLASVRTAAFEIRTLAPTLDVIINNAGVMAIPERTLSADGFEMHLATNFLGHFLLTKLLTPQLERSPDARVVNITSAGFVLAPFRFSDYNFTGAPNPLPLEEQVDTAAAGTMGFAGLDPSTGYVPMIAYAQANTANMLFSRGLAERGVSAFSAAPGGMYASIHSATHYAPFHVPRQTHHLPTWLTRNRYCLVVLTELQRHLPPDFRNPYMVYKSASQGAASFLVAALDPALRGA